MTPVVVLVFTVLAAAPATGIAHADANISCTALVPFSQRSLEPRKLFGSSRFPVCCLFRHAANAHCRACRYVLPKIQVQLEIERQTRKKYVKVLGVRNLFIENN